MSKIFDVILFFCLLFQLQRFVNQLVQTAIVVVGETERNDQKVIAKFLKAHSK